jgi:hypothetical protein
MSTSGQPILPLLSGIMEAEHMTRDPLKAGLTYYWRIDEKNDNGTTTGDVWSFKIQSNPAGKTGNPVPAQYASYVRKNALLHWDEAGNATHTTCISEPEA